MRLHDAPPGQPERKSRPEYRPNLVCFSDIERREIRWLWRDRIPSGCITSLVGRPGCGKSFVSCDFAARISRGEPWPDGQPCERGSVLMISAEDDPHMIVRPRLDACGADVSRIHLLSTKLLLNENGEQVETLIDLRDVSMIEDALQRLPDCRLIIVDPIGSFLGGGVDAYRDNEVRGVLGPVAKLAERYGPAVLCVVHTRKGNAANADDLALGSRAFVGISRSVWHCMHDSEQEGRHLLLPGKSNVSPKRTGLGFHIEGDPAAVQWEADEVMMHADDAMNTDEDKSALDEAVDWLRNQLVLGAVAGKTIKHSAKRDGIAEITLKRAKKKLGVQSAPDGMGGPWQWFLPDPSQTGSSKPSVAHSRGMIHVIQSDDCPFPDHGSSDF
ncbi:MAG: AAA family ATPase [Rubinisphaera brasiliensis]|uniref:AAA family ATPase n=1 Tax=Rubinisphaera brasiliensis TaxID=119 RepID=UPI00391C8349